MLMFKIYIQKKKTKQTKALNNNDLSTLLFA